MSVQDFIQRIQEEDNDVIYSKPPEESIQMIPPDKPENKINVNNNSNNIRVIPPKEETPKVIKFKLSMDIPLEKEEVEKVSTPEKLPDIKLPPKNPEKPDKRKIQEKIPEKQKTQEKQPQNINRDNKQDLAEELFIKSETPLNKKELWFEYYNKALNSKKNNFITEKCKRGRFTINEENKFIVLSDYDTYGKDANEILRDSWF